MSASNKKKLRKEENASKMTARQTQAEKEAKQLKRYTAAFVTIIAIVLVAAIAIVTARGVIQSGTLQTNSIAAVVGDKELSAVELSYYYFDAIDENYSNWYSEYGSNTAVYLQLLYGLDISKALDKQIYDSKTNQTWAGFFVDQALANAKRNYVLCNLAKEANYELPEDTKKSIDSQIATLQFWAAYSGYSNIDKYLGATYCYGANVDNYRAYLEQSLLANSYLEHYAESLSYTDEQIREFEKEKLINYNSYSYASCYLSYTYFLGEGTKNDKGEVTYTDEERDAARAKAKEVAESLLGNKNFDELKLGVNALEINKDKTNASASNNENVKGSSLPALLKDWITSADRVVGDTTVIVNEYTSSTSTDSENKDENKTETEEEKKEEEKVINGYYVVVFTGFNDNKVNTVDVHHLLKAFKDNGNDNKKDDDGKVIYTEDEIEEAKEAAEKLVEEWAKMEGGKTLENFKKLVEKNTDDTGSASTGGLYENIAYDQSYVKPFLDWCIAEERQVGDSEIIQTEYGFHIMYFAEINEMNYRDLLITDDMRTEDTNKWYEAELEKVTANLKDMQWIALDTIIAAR